MRFKQTFLYPPSEMSVYLYKILYEGDSNIMKQVALIDITQVNQRISNIQTIINDWIKHKEELSEIKEIVDIRFEKAFDKELILIIYEKIM